MERPPLPSSSTFLQRRLRATSMVASTVVMLGGEPSTWSRNMVNRKAVSSGPPCASGWNCTLKKGRCVWMMPSLLLSLALMKKGFQCGGSVLESMA
jgi:hypothetical protein